MTSLGCIRETVLHSERKERTTCHCNAGMLSSDLEVYFLNGSLEKKIIMLGVTSMSVYVHLEIQVI